MVLRGYAVAYHGYPRTTGDIDIWVKQTEENAARLVRALNAFGFDVPALQPSIFLIDDQIIRMGNPPLRVEILTSASGVDFDYRFEQRTEGSMGGVQTTIIGLECLKKNKRASGRHKDLSDLENLP